MAELRSNRAKHKLAGGGVVSLVAGDFDSDLAEFLGEIGLDGIWIDSEHGSIDYRDITDLTRACDLWGMTSVVRVPFTAPAAVYRALDRGAQGVIIPHVNTAAEARAVVDAAKFDPIGHRGSYTSRQGLAVEGYFQKANDETLVVVMLEEVEALHNLPEMLQVDHIDVFFLAPGDLAQSYGVHGQRTHPHVLDGIYNAIDQITAAGRIAGLPATPEEWVGDYIARGARFFSVPWLPWTAAGARTYLERVATATR